MKKSAFKIAAACILFGVVFAIGSHFLMQKTTYLEQTALTFVEEDVLKVSVPEDMITETFQMPYDILKKLAFRITNYQTDCNTPWTLLISDRTGNTVCEKEFRFTNAADNGIYTLDLNKAYSVNKGEMYTLSLYAKKISSDTPIGFYYGTNLTTAGEASTLTYNGAECAGALCLSVYGGDTDLFWVVIYAVVLFVLLLVVLRGILLTQRGLDWKGDPWMQAALCGLLVFFACLPFAAMGSYSFTDENDNIRGGMLLARGHVLYRDYVTQHTPFAYYLCGVFALLGAASATQMRILLYICFGILWTFLYHRHQKNLPGWVLYLIPVLSIFTPAAMTGAYTTMVVAESMQMQAFIVIMLELYALWKDQKMSWGRCIVVSLAAWTAIGSVFMSAYTLFFFVLIFAVLEIRYWKTCERKAGGILKRYLPLVITGSIPGICGILYFKVNHALYYAIRQMYLFNREVYTKYQDMGSSILEPFFSGIVSALTEFQNAILMFGAGGGIKVYHVLVLLILGAAVFVLIKAFTKNRTEWGVLLLGVLAVASGAARGVDDWHGQAFWGMLVTGMLLLLSKERVWSGKSQTIAKLAVISYALMILQPFAAQLRSDITSKQEAVSYLDPIILNELDEGEAIFMDAYCNDSIYLLAKGHEPVNRAVYCLPWYMDWYESWNLEDLKKNKPDVVVWNPDQECWNQYHYAVLLDKYIQENYKRIGEGATIWVKEDK